MIVCFCPHYNIVIVVLINSCGSHQKRSLNRAHFKLKLLFLAQNIKIILKIKRHQARLRNMPFKNHTAT